MESVIYSKFVIGLLVNSCDLDGKMYFCTGSLGRKEYSYGYFWEEKEKPNLKEFGYQDNLIVTGEPFALWVIESEKA